MKLSHLCMGASIGCIVLSVIFLYANPYSHQPPNGGTVRICLYLLILPACAGLVNSFVRNRLLMAVVLIWSLPLGLYFAVASIPSIWNLYGVVLCCYLICVMRMKAEAKGDVGPTGF